MSNIANGVAGADSSPVGVAGERPASLSPGTLLARLVQGLARAGVRYCCWKRPADLERVLCGQGDLDLLVDPEHVQAFLAVADGLGFRRAVSDWDPRQCLGLHLYGLDPAGGELAHLHVSQRLLAEASSPAHDRAVEELVLRSSAPMEGAGPLAEMPMADAPAELIARLLCTLLRYARLSEYPLLARQGERPAAKVRNLLGRCAAAEARARLGRDLPCLPPELFDECVDALAQPASWWKRHRLARRLQRQLAKCCDAATVLGGLRRTRTLVRGAWRRWVYGPAGTRRLAAGGAVIAFVGPEACGKSTLVAETAAWLGKTFPVYRAHLGKPPPTWLTLLPNLARRLLGRLVPRLRAGGGLGAETGGKGPARKGLLHRLRAVLLAYDRQALARRLARRAARGWVVICDRYPSAQVGAADSARFPVPAAEERGVGACLARLEQRLYRRVPCPAVVLRLSIPLPVAIQRNRERFKVDKESDAYVARRHRSFVPPSFANVPTVEVDTSLPQPVTVRRLRHMVWQALAGGLERPRGRDGVPGAVGDGVGEP